MRECDEARIVPMTTRCDNIKHTNGQQPLMLPHAYTFVGLCVNCTVNLSYLVFVVVSNVCWEIAIFVVVDDGSEGFHIIQTHMAIECDSVLSSSVIYVTLRKCGWC